MSELGAAMLYGGLRKAVEALTNLKDLSPCDWWWFAVYVALAAVVIRLTSSFLKARELILEKPAERTYANTLKPIFLKGVAPKPEESDFYLPTILGVFELGGYPFLMAVEKWEYIGAWLAFKTFGQWKHWGVYRSTFNRFLIGNAMVLFASFVALRLFF